MPRPKVNITLQNGGLGIEAPSEFGTCGLIIAASTAPTAGYGNPFLVKSKAEAATKWGANAAIVAAIQNYFYAEAPEGTKLYCLALSVPSTMQNMATPANAEKLLVFAGGAIRILGFGNTHAGGYTPVITEGFDVDVHNCVTNAQTLASAWVAKKQPFDFFVEGQAYSGLAADAKDYSTAADRNGHIVVGTLAGATLPAMLLAMGRAARVSPQENIGRVKRGSLKIDPAVTVLVGGYPHTDPAIEAELDALHDKRYITFEKNAAAPGFVFTDDVSLTEPIDDYNSLRNTRVINNAVRVAFSTYYRELKDDVEVDAGGRLAPEVEKALETAIETAIDQAMGNQLSKDGGGKADVTCLVNPDVDLFGSLYDANDITDPDFNIQNGGNVYLFLSLRPKGCLKQFNVFLGFTA